MRRLCLVAACLTISVTATKPLSRAAVPLGMGKRGHSKCRFHDARASYGFTCPAGLKDAPLGTIVTSYLHTPSKRPAEVYLDRMKAFFKLDAAVVAYIDVPYIDYAESLVQRPEHTIIVPTSFSEFRTMGCGLDVWRRQHQLDTGERHHHTPPLYTLWAEKTSMLARVARTNCFDSRYFSWLDIGYFSEVPPPSGPLPTPSFAASMPPRRMLMLAVDPGNVRHARSLVGHDGRMTAALGQGAEWATVNIGGGGMAGDADAVALWDAAYIAMLDRYIAAGWFAGKDQNLFTSVCAEQPSLCVLHPTHGDWYMLPRLLNGSVVIRNMLDA